MSEWVSSQIDAAKREIIELLLSYLKLLLFISTFNIVEYSTTTTTTENIRNYKIINMANDVISFADTVHLIHLLLIFFF